MSYKLLRPQLQNFLAKYPKGNSRDFHNYLRIIREIGEL